MIDKKLVSMRFSNAAENYDLHTDIQRRMADEIIIRLKKIFPLPTRDLNILDIGCGTGYLLGEMLPLFPEARITATDIAEGMLETVHEQSKFAGIHLVQTDAEEWEPESDYDIIVSNAVFQWFNDPAKTIDRYAKALSMEGIFLLATFGPRTFNELHESFRIATEQKYAGTRPMPGMEFPDSAMLCKNLDKKKFKFRENTFLSVKKFSSVNLLLKNLRTIGANSSNPESIRANLPIVKEALHVYERKFSIGGCIPATYESLLLEISRNSK